MAAAALLALLALATAAPAGAQAPRRADLVVRAVTGPPASAAPGARFAVEDLVVNEGGRRAGSSWTGYRLVGGVRRHAVGGRAVPPLPRRGRSRGTAPLTLPAAIPDGDHELLACADDRDQVREADEGDNCLATSLRIDGTAPPPPTIHVSPPDPTGATEARFEFSAEEAGLGFECRLDEGAFAPCASPVSYTGLPEGRHRFAVRARDTAGNESAPAVHEWTIVADEVTLGDGAWSWFADPRAVRDPGPPARTYVGWVARDGDVKVAAYDHESLTRTTAVLRSRLEVDDHANPALQILPDRRIRVFYSAHGGGALWYRTSLRPGDVSAWSPEARLPANTPGPFGFTYPNPIHLAAEGRTYLFWRGGNWNPTFASLPDPGGDWTPPRTLITAPNARPYAKYASDGADTIHIAFTNAHPGGASDVNLYYAAYRGGTLHRADGTTIGTLGTPIAPAAADVVFDDATARAWVHDVTPDAAGRPVIVFAAFPSPTDHRYAYARWTGGAWEVHEITPAGGSISADGREPYYSGGLTLDHEDAAVVYLSRPVAGMWEIETWRTPDGGATWTRQAVTAESDAKNVRPVSPRGLIPFSADLSVVWMRGIYTSYIDYRTSITTLLRTAGNAPPVADATATPSSGPAPLPVVIDGRASTDPDGSVVAWEWDLGDGTRASGAEARHTYEQPGRYFPSLTVTDDAGARDVFIGEVVVEPFAAPAVFTGPASEVDAGSATITGTVNPSNQRTTYRFEYGPTAAYGSSTAEQTLSEADAREHPVAARLAALTPGARNHYRLVAANATGTSAGEDRTFTSAPPGGSAYREAVLATEGLRAYWRLGELSGSGAVDATGAHPGTYAGGVRLGEPGALAGDPDTAAGFDGTSGEMTAAGPALTSSGSLEGWFDWRQGVAVLRDHTSTGAVGWILAYESAGRLLYRVGGTAFDTGVPIAAVRDGWHHLVVTREDAAVGFHLDGRRVHAGTGAGAAAPVAPWHVMRNGNQPTQYAQGRADEVAIYDRALSAATVRRHYELGTAR